jgi:hypothetical protein
MNRISISRVSLIVSVVFIVLAGFTLSVPPDYAAIFAIAALAAIPAVVAGPRKYRIIGVLVFALCVYLIANQYRIAKHDPLSRLYEGRNRGGEQQGGGYSPPAARSSEPTP